jgi:hypothetical protein
MQNIYTEILTRLKTKVPTLRYINWDIGQLDGYYLKPSVTFPCALISFPQINTEPIGNNALMADVVMNIKLCTEKLSNTSNLVPATVMAKGNEIWVLQKAITKALHGTDGTNYNTIQQISIQQEQREDGLNVLNIQLGFIAEDFTNIPITHIITPMGAYVMDADNPIALPPTGTLQIADFATFNSNSYLEDIVAGGGQYGYRCINFFSSGVYTNINYTKSFSRTNTKTLDVQIPPYDTIPAYTVNSFNYDKNWIDFLQDLFTNIGWAWMRFNTSPYDGKKEQATYPIGMQSGVYGEGFQLAWPQNYNWSFEIEYMYDESGTGDWATNHTVRFTNDGMYVDGALVSYANGKIITL